MGSKKIIINTITSSRPSLESLMFTVRIVLPYIQDMVLFLFKAINASKEMNIANATSY